MLDARILGVVQCEILINDRDTGPLGTVCPVVVVVGAILMDRHKSEGIAVSGSNSEVNHQACMNISTWLASPKASFHNFAQRQITRADGMDI